MNDIRSVILVALGVAGCGRTCGYGPTPFERRWTTRDLTRSELDYATPENGTVADADCSVFCEAPCAIDLDLVAIADTAASPDTGASSDTGAAGSEIVGQLRCSDQVYLPTHPCGRRPLGYVATPSTAHTLGEVLADMAHLEASAAVAFRQIAQGLTRWGAPSALVQRARDAAAEEVQHTRLLARLARHHGAAKRPYFSPRVPLRMFDMAMQNATEGCIFEVWGAAYAELVARYSGEAEIRRAFAQIAMDEARHGNLSWDLHRWFSTQLDADDWQKIERAQRDALHKLPMRASDETNTAPPVFGLPEAATVEELARHVARVLSTTDIEPSTSQRSERVVVGS